MGQPLSKRPLNGIRQHLPPSLKIILWWFALTSTSIRWIRQKSFDQNCLKTRVQADPRGSLERKRPISQLLVKIEIISWHWQKRETIDSLISFCFNLIYPICRIGSIKSYLTAKVCSDKSLRDMFKSNEGLRCFFLICSQDNSGNLVMTKETKREMIIKSVNTSVLVTNLSSADKVSLKNVRI